MSFANFQKNNLSLFCGSIFLVANFLIRTLFVFYVVKKFCLFLSKISFEISVVANLHSRLSIPYLIHLLPYNSSSLVWKI